MSTAVLTAPAALVAGTSPATHAAAALPTPHAVPGARGAVVVLRGTDTATGRVGTWHVTPLEGTDACEVEHVEGHVMSEAVWMQTAKTSVAMTGGEVAELVARVEPCC
ncbi:hypothetical protein [Cellulomonas marina]|uniref:Uncharacterized protein n=1 Tax=Cellulomonas marina TaxID=988821 RepID=A0A1I0V9T4_9CELL|nr:hypothetical protein [Cellulomonas marina]GIG29196.1 hypothetical protein Cma02nite_17960 [Cellulomonas marina]SFA73091.1 hypothetical protein SAMN05421867_101262 [Cellulomonas marina]